MSSIYDKLGEERKKLQKEGLMPHWMTTAGWQMFKERYLYQATNPREQYMRIATTLSAHTPDPEKWKTKFFDIMWKGWVSLSTPVLANTGTTRGMPVSCSGSYISDDLGKIYDAKKEVAMLTKMGFGTASDLSNIRPRGSAISRGGKSSGVMEVIKGFMQDMGYVRQGDARRGSWAGYLNVEHGDFDEVCDFLKANPDGNNIGWTISNSFIDKLIEGDKEARRRFAKQLQTKMVTGKGYHFFVDKANKRAPQWYKDQGLKIHNSQLCSEIMLHNSEDLTYTCVLSSMNAFFYDEWKDTDAVFVATVMLDCVAQEFIERAKNVDGLEKAVEFTKKSRALGLGVCGFHSYLQDHMMPFDSVEAIQFNLELFKKMQKDSIEASKWIASIYGEPEFMKGTGRANTHLIAVAPTKSTALIMGGISEGINPDAAMVYTQRTTAGEVSRINPVLLKIMKERGVYNKNTLSRINENMGSVQDEDWLTDFEKLVFRTAFEIRPEAVLDMSVIRADYIDQWQSMNLFVDSRWSEEEIAKLHVKAFLNPKVLAIYYIYSQAGVQASSDKDECQNCQ